MNFQQKCRPRSTESIAYADAIDHEAFPDGPGRVLPVASLTASCAPSTVLVARAERLDYIPNQGRNHLPAHGLAFVSGSGKPGKAIGLLV